MKKVLAFSIGIILILFFSILIFNPRTKVSAEAGRHTEIYPYVYPWMDAGQADYRIQDIPLPKGYTRIPVSHPSFAGWIRQLPLLPPGSPVMLHNGRKKPDQTLHYAVVNIDIGSRDFQQCADALMRLRAEYLYSREMYSAIHFNFVSGFTAGFDKWSEGYRIQVKGSKVWWEHSGTRSKEYKFFRSYLNRVFEYANSYSLQEETSSIPLADIQVGDVFLIGGFPGHGVLVVDVARDSTSRTIFMIAQSYMPAQSIHVLKSFEKISPWYSLDFGTSLLTPSWEFSSDQLRRF